MRLGSSTTWIVLLVVLAVLAILSGFWAIEAAFKIVLYVVLALLAIWAVMMLIRAGKDAAGGRHHV